MVVPARIDSRPPGRKATHTNNGEASAKATRAKVARAPAAEHATSPDGMLARLRDLITAFLLRIVMAISSDERAFLLRDLSDPAASELGANVNAVGVARECVRCLALTLPWVLKGRLGDFGLKSARMMAEDLRTLLPMIDAHVLVDIVPDTADTPVATTVPVPQRVFTAAELALTRRALNKLTRNSDAFKPELVRAMSAQPDASLRARARCRTLAQIAYVRKTLPQGLLDDAGLPTATLAALETALSSELAAAMTRRASRTAKQAMRSDFTVLVGRLVYQLRRLAQAANAQRNVEKTVPVIVSSYVQHHVPRVKPVVAVPAPGATVTVNAPTAIPPTH